MLSMYDMKDLTFFRKTSKTFYKGYQNLNKRKYKATNVTISLTNSLHEI